MDRGAAGEVAGARGLGASEATVRTLTCAVTLYSQQKQDQELTIAQIMNSLLPNSDLNEESRENH